MASDVDTTIREVIAQFANADEVGVDSYMQKLLNEHRYQRNVY